jgi:hypothetical protein
MAVIDAHPLFDTILEIFGAVILVIAIKTVRVRFHEMLSSTVSGLTCGLGTGTL